MNIGSSNPARKLQKLDYQYKTIIEMIHQILKANFEAAPKY